MGVLPKLFGEHATKVSGFGYSYTGLCGLTCILIVKNFLSTFGYMAFYIAAGVMSCISFLLLVFVFKEEMYRP